MTTKTDITQLPCPFCGGHEFSTDLFGDVTYLRCIECGAVGPLGLLQDDDAGLTDVERRATEAWNRRAAVEADLQGRMPSDEEIRALAREIYGQTWGGADIRFARALLSRYRSGQPIVCHECGGDGAGGLHEDDCSQNSSSQPVAWMTADGRVATDDTKRNSMSSPSREAFCIPLGVINTVEPKLDAPAASAEVTHGLLQQFFATLDDALSKERASPWTGLKGAKFQDRMLAWDRVRELREQLLATASEASVASAEPCFCDRVYPDSNPDATCGDCPRDYRSAAPVAQEPVSVTERWQDGDDSNMVSRVDTTAPVAAQAQPDDAPYPFLPDGWIIHHDPKHGYMAQNRSRMGQGDWLPTRQAATACAWAMFSAQPSAQDREDASCQN